MRALSQKLTLTGLFLIYSYLLFGQWDKTTWGEVPASDLSMQVYPADSNAEAAVLADCGYLHILAGNTTTGPIYHLKRHRRIKLLKRSSFERYGQLKIFFIHDEGKESIEELKAQTILPNGSVYEVASEDIFQTKENKRVSSVSCAFPNLEIGAIIEFKYDLVSSEVIEPRTWYFQEEIPVRYNSLRIRNQSSITYISLFNGEEQFSEKEETGNAVLYRKGNTHFSYGAERIVMENAPAMVAEEFMTTLEDYRAKIRLQGESYLRPDGRLIQLFTSWERSAKSLLNHEQFGLQFRRKYNFKKVLDKVKTTISSEMPPGKILETVFDFVTENVAYNGKESFWTQKNLNRVYIEKKGNAGEINLMCLALLRAFNLEAFPVLISTREHGKMFQHYPLLDQFNYVLVGVKLGTNIVLLDATDPSHVINMPRPNALNKYGWVVDLDNLSWIDIQVPTCRDIYGSELHLDKDGNLKVKLRAVFNNYTALAEQHHYQADENGEYWKARLETFANEVELHQVDVKELNDKSGKLMSEVYFSIPSGAVVSGNYLYVPPILYSKFEENPFKLKERAYPVDFSYPFEERYVMSLHIPDGYEVEEVPEPTHFELPEKAGHFEYKVSHTGDKVQLMLSLLLNNTTIDSAHYAKLKTMFDLMIAKRSEQIVLKKISDK